MDNENEKELTLTRLVDAPRERVWEALTDAGKVAVWWGPKGVTNPECELDARAGGKLRIAMLAGPELGALAGARWPMEGTFTEVVPLEKLSFTSNALDETGAVLLAGATTISLSDESGKTAVSVSTRAEGRSPQAPQMLAGMEQGWNEQMDKLAALFG